MFCIRKLTIFLLFLKLLKKCFRFLQLENNAQFYVTVKTHLSSLAWIIAWFNLGSSWDKQPLPITWHHHCNSWKSFGGKTKSQCPLNCWRHLEFKFTIGFTQYIQHNCLGLEPWLCYIIHWSIELFFIKLWMATLCMQLQNEW